MVEWWDDDDDDSDDDGVPPASQAPSASPQEPSSVPSSSSSAAPPPKKKKQKKKQHFTCRECGSSEYYTNTVSGNSVCLVCKCEAENSQELASEFDDVNIMGARTAGGKFRSKTKDHKTRRILKSLEEEDASVRLPDLSDCIAGMRYLLRHCIHLLIQDVLPNDPLSASMMDDVDDGPRKTTSTQRLEEVVRALWLGYLRAWSDGAQHYGKLYPQMRFSFRDYFLNQRQIRDIVTKTLVYKAKTAAVSGNNTAGKHTKTRGRVKGDDDEQSDAVSEEEEEPLEPQEDSQSSAIKEDVDKIGEAETQDDESRSDFGKAASSNAMAKSSSAAKQAEEGTDDPKQTDKDQKAAAAKVFANPSAFPKFCAKHLKKTEKVTMTESYMNMLTKALPKDARHLKYQEAALALRPNMMLVAAILWMGMTHSGIAVVTAPEMCTWIRDGTLPLASAFGMGLSRRLQEKLWPVASFFRINGSNPVSPEELESAATKLVIAARFRRSHATVIYKLRQQCHVQYAWNARTLPLIIAKVISNAGLPQDVLDRTLYMAGLKACVLDPKKVEEKSKAKAFPVAIPPRLTTPEYITSMSEILALIFIAVQMDPLWRLWEFSYNNSTALPIHEGEAQYQDPVESLGRAVKVLYPSDSISFLPPQLASGLLPAKETPPASDDDDDERPRVRPCSVLGGKVPPPKPLHEHHAWQLDHHEHHYDLIHQKPNRCWVSCDFHQDRLLEYLAFTADIKNTDPIRSAMDLFVRQEETTVGGVRLVHRLSLKERRKDTLKRPRAPRRKSQPAKKRRKVNAKKAEI